MKSPVPPSASPVFLCLSLPPSARSGDGSSELKEPNCNLWPAVLQSNSSQRRKQRRIPRSPRAFPWGLLCTLYPAIQIQGRGTVISVCYGGRPCNMNWALSRAKALYWCRTLPRTLGQPGLTFNSLVRSLPL